MPAYSCVITHNRHSSSVRILSWNIQHGGGNRYSVISSTIVDQNPDLICLVEFRHSKGSDQIAQRLADAGWGHQVTTRTREFENQNSLFMASRQPLTLLPFPEYPIPHRILIAHLEAFGGSVALVHVPNRRDAFVNECREQILQWTRLWDNGPCLVIGDTNTGKPVLDEESSYFNKREGAWMTAMDDAGWVDAWRHLHGEKRVYSWREQRKGSGFRIDQGFVSPHAHHLLESVDYCWFPQADGSTPSDHAALILDFHTS